MLLRDKKMSIVGMGAGVRLEQRAYLLRLVRSLVVERMDGWSG
jgi:hypothetical protein